MANMKRKDFGEHKQVYVNYGGNYRKFFWLENKMVSLIEVEINCGDFLRFF